MRAAVCRPDHDLFCLEELSIDDPRPDEVLVRFTATGLCHTDLEVAAGRLPTPFPVVAGHEGTGVVEAVGSAVDGFRPGDRVVASFSFCGTCQNCLRGQPAYCPQHFPLNFGAQRADGSVGLHDAAGEPVRDHFFGQSSFAGYGLCRLSSLIRVPATTVPDHVLAPLGCGVITGAGAVWNALRVYPGSTIAVFGAGAVGLSAVMAAAVAGASRIIVCDIHRPRLDLALQLGATDVFDANGGACVETVRELTSGAGVDFSVESTGVPEVMSQAVAALAPLGSAAILGIAPDGADLRTNAFGILEGRTVTGSIVGHQAPAVLVPRVLALHEKGLFPLEAMISTYALDDINKAVDDVRSGTVVKAVLLH
ncbi:MAG: NAD(P)-dependent alcohol dehydrogenase [Amycolatopsis sp.]|uniref:NAD(P)-dependent alcohol dehydrogenase n=1 Tax=Amycolatopsis sp. TaxID=37632 RepID=UPI0026176534|nr:NAD(P)-dependent alcohol dehydrogenase [Amycolatopsis sp.]MCU1683970.1 NAD(P)-dependent alcohol dehydrogenase [Amycolatopsis sp.]